jgi:hypothetical protein
MLGRTVGELLATIDERELSEWAVFFDLEPFGPLADAYNSATISATLANVFGGHERSFTPFDFLPEHVRPPANKRRQSPAERNLADFMAMYEANQ